MGEDEGEDEGEGRVESGVDEASSGINADAVSIVCVDDVVESVEPVDRELVVDSTGGCPCSPRPSSPASMSS